MQARKILITLCNNEVAPRFDMTAEVLIVSLDAEHNAAHSKSNLDSTPSKHLILAHTSSKELCDLIVRANINIVVCGGIEDDYLHYLRWKRIEVISNVMGEIPNVLQQLLTGSLETGACLYSKRESNEHQFAL